MNIDDNNLIKEYLGGDEKSFEVLIKRYLKLIYNYTYRRINSIEEADDITQEIFLKVWRNIKKFDQNKKFKSWIFTIAKNTVIDWLKKKKTIPFSSFEDEHGNNPLIDRLTDKTVFCENNFAYAINRLSLEHQKIVFLRNNDYLSFKEIAKTLGEPINTTKSRYRRAIIKLKQIIK